MLTCRKNINDLKPYVPGKPIEDVQKEYGLTDVIKIASNENPYGCSPLAKEAITSALDRIALYPDGNATVLKESVAKHLGVASNQLLFGAGSDEIITMLAEVFINPGDEAISCTPSFPRYKSAVQLMDGQFIEVPTKNYTFDLDGILDAITDKTRIIFIANPNNPTGTIVTAEEQRAFLNKVPNNILVVLDEAYYEFAMGGAYPESLPLLKEYDNTIILRTFSKAYGLASLRVGYAISNAVTIDLLNRVRGPFNVTSLAQLAAVAALKDQEFVRKTMEMNAEVKAYSYKKCDELGIEYAESHTNFVMMDVKQPGNELFVELQKKGVIIRPIGPTTLIRVTLGTMDEMEKFFAEIEKLL
ncbi:histidinol-phosphate transaminase [Vallitalea okinawensis]|uniref:histidinol-phosphate transaminase n=1 Tax=Vallitalea okinawensis TaxID=2078660 RepID=UPI000CFCD365|nr:histidinol-phosphate transaminase [Vallitalea okinawensis]